MQKFISSRGRRVLAPLTVVAACAATVGTAQAVHWPLYGGDAGRSGYQPVEEPAPPLPLVYEKTGATEQNVRNSIITSAGGGPEVQRLSFGTEGDGQGQTGNVHLQRLSDGAPIGPEAGFPIDSVDDDPDTFGPLTFARNLRPAGVSFADSSTATSLGQVYAVHNDDDQSATGDIAIARTDEASGNTVDAFGVEGTTGFTIYSSPLITGAAADDPATMDVDETGNRTLFFVAYRPADNSNPALPRPAETRLFRVPITNNAATQDAAFGPVTSREVPGGNPVASPALAFLDTTDDGTANPTPFVVVSANGPNTVQTYDAATLAPGPRSDDLGDDGQTPLVPVQGNGQLAPSADAIFVAVGQTANMTANANTRVYKLTLATGALTPTATSPTLAGTPAPAMALDQEDQAGSDASANGDLAVTTSRNFFTVRAGDLTPRARFAFNDDLTGGDTGFSRTTAAVSGGLAFVARDNGQQLVLRLSTAQPVTPTEFTQDPDNDDATMSFGQPSISRRFVQFASDQGVFVYRGTPGSFSVNDVEVIEGDSGTRNLVFTITRSGATSDAQSITIDTTGGTATPGTDYTDPGEQTITFAPGQETATYVVPVRGDVVREPDETVVVTLSDATGGAVLGDATGTGTILDDDPGEPTTFSIGDVQLTEGDAGEKQAVFTVTKSGPGGGSVTVSTQDGTATVADNDFEAKSATLTFAPGDTSKTFSVTVNGDTKDEDTETFLAVLSGASGGTSIADGRGTATITDDDDAPQAANTVSVGDASLGEGDSGTRDLTFTVSLARPADSQTAVAFGTIDRTATAGSDYTARTGTVTFEAGEQSKTITVPVNGDLVDEGDETFLVRLSSPSNATLGDAEATGTIVDDDRASLSVGDATASEGDTGAAEVAVTVSLSSPSDSEVTVDFATANGTATAGSDYTSTTGTLTFAPGQTSKTVEIPVRGDVADEPAETFAVVLSDASGASIDDARGTVTIVDDDEPTRFSIGDVQVTEGDAGETLAAFTVTKSGPAGGSVTVATSDGTATVADNDYEAKTGTLAFAVGDTSKRFVVTVNGDTKDESTETFTATLSGATAGTAIADGTATGTIGDDDDAPAPPATVSVGDASVGEGDAGTRQLTLTVSLSRPASAQTTVRFATVNGTAAAGSDYTATGGTVTFASGEQSKFVSVPVTGDLVDEADETFLVRLSEPTNATLGDAEGIGTISDDDKATLSVGDATVDEGSAGGAAVVTVSLSTPSASRVTVDFGTADGTAIAGSDYTGTAGTLTFEPGETSKTISVPVSGDTADEAAETFVVNLGNAVGAALGDAQATVTVVDDDDPAPAPTVTPAPTATPTPTPTVTPTPVTPVAAKKFTLRVTPNRDRKLPFRFRARGKVTRPKGVSKAQGCSGEVAIRVLAGKDVLIAREVRLSKKCRYSTRLTFRDADELEGVRRLKVTARFLGNFRIKATSKRTARVRIR